MRCLIVPGLAVRGYAQAACERLTSRGLEATLLPAPGEPGSPARLDAYGDDLGARIDGGPDLDLLIGLSVGTQAAAVAAAATTRLRRLLLVAPTVDPAARTVPKLLGRWAAAGLREDPRLLASQAPDWWSAGPRALRDGVRSAVAVELERVLPRVGARLTVVHPEADRLTSHDYAASLVAGGGRLVVVPGASHSWPHGDADRFADLVEEDVR